MEIDNDFWIRKRLFETISGLLFFNRRWRRMLYYFASRFLSLLTFSDLGYRVQGFGSVAVPGYFMFISTGESFLRFMLPWFWFRWKLCIDYGECYMRRMRGKSPDYWNLNRAFKDIHTEPSLGSVLRFPSLESCVSFTSGFYCIEETIVPGMCDVRLSFE